MVDIVFDSHKLELRKRIDSISHSRWNYFQSNIFSDDSILSEGDSEIILSGVYHDQTAKFVPGYISTYALELSKASSGSTFELRLVLVIFFYYRNPFLHRRECVREQSIQDPSANNSCSIYFGIVQRGSWFQETAATHFPGGLIIARTDGRALLGQAK